MGGDFIADSHGGVVSLRAIIFASGAAVAGLAIRDGDIGLEHAGPAGRFLVTLGAIFGAGAFFEKRPVSRAEIIWTFSWVTA